MAKRDFREETIGVLGENLGADIVDTNAGEFGDGWDNFWTGFGDVFGVDDLKEDMSNVKKHLRKVCELNDITAAKFQEIVENVREVEQRYAGLFADGADALASYSAMVSTLNAEMEGQFPDSVNFDSLAANLGLHQQQITAHLQQHYERFQQEIDAEVAQMYDAEGNYNWSYVENLLHSNPEDLTQAQVVALGLLFLQMEATPDGQTAEQNMERFIQCGYVHRTVVDIDGRPVGTEVVPSDALLLVAYVNTMTVSVLAEQSIWNPEIPESAYPLDAEQIEQYALRAALLNDVCNYANPIRYDDISSGGFPEDYISRSPVQIAMEDGKYVLQVAKWYVVSEGQYKISDAYVVEGFPLSGESALLGDFHHDGSIQYYQRLMPGGGNWLGEWGAGQGAEMTLQFMVAGLLGCGVSALTLPVTMTISAVVAGGTALLKGMEEARVAAGINGRISATDYVFSVQMLGGSMQYSMCDGDTLYVHRLVIDERELWLRLQGYNHNAGDDASQQELLQVVLNGDPDLEGWEPLPEEDCGMSEQEQRDLYGGYRDYFEEDEIRADYKDNLEDYLNVHKKDFDGKTSIRNLTLKELTQLTDMYNNQ